MLKDAKNVIARADRTFVQDAIGAVSLMVILFGTLHLPSLL